MLALRDLQSAFADHLTGCERDDLAAAVQSDRIPAAARLAIYRHHLRYSLTGALAATFPTVQALVGADFFARLAGDFIAKLPPQQPVLSEYGADLPAFIAKYAAAGGLPYLADVARLDWALNVAFHAAAPRPLTIGDLSAVAVERLPSHGVALAAGACLIDSRYPIDRIWQAAQPDAGEGTVDLEEGACQLVVLPGAPSSFFVSLSGGEAAFLAALSAGHTLEEAAGAAFKADPAFGLSKSFARLLQLGAFAALQ
jgi:hypothetical protein